MFLNLSRFQMHLTSTSSENLQGPLLRRGFEDLIRKFACSTAQSSTRRWSQFRCIKETKQLVLATNSNRKQKCYVMNCCFSAFGNKSTVQLNIRIVVPNHIYANPQELSVDLLVGIVFSIWECSLQHIVCNQSLCKTELT